MILSKNEAACLALFFSKKKTINSETKLNKLVARLNLYFIPVDIKFNLKTYGSCAQELAELSEQENDFFSVYKYSFNEEIGHSYQLNTEGIKLVETEVLPKLKEAMSNKEIFILQEDIESKSELDASSISAQEHDKLLVEPEDRFKLIQRINSTNIDYLDLYSAVNGKRQETFAEIRMAALIEYCYYFTEYLKNKFKRLSENEYNYDAPMIDYYFLNNMRTILPSLNEFLVENQIDFKKISEYYDYFLNSCKIYDYPFSLDNPNLKDFLLI